MAKNIHNAKWLIGISWKNAHICRSKLFFPNLRISYWPARLIILNLSFLVARLLVSQLKFILQLQVNVVSPQLPFLVSFSSVYRTFWVNLRTETRINGWISAADIHPAMNQICSTFLRINFTVISTRLDLRLTRFPLEFSCRSSRQHRCNQKMVSRTQVARANFPW